MDRLKTDHWKGQFITVDNQELTRTHFTKTRLVPTPSGYLHPGHIFDLTASLAHRANAAILLHIADLYPEWEDPALIEDIFACLSFLSISWDEEPSSGRNWLQPGEKSAVHLLPVKSHGRLTNKT